MATWKAPIAVRRCAEIRQICQADERSQGQPRSFAIRPTISVSGNIGGRGKIQHPEFAFASGEMQPAQYREFLSQTLGNGAHVSAAGAVHFASTDWRHIADLIEVGRGIYGAMLNLVVWNKSNAGQGSFYR